METVTAVTYGPTSFVGRVGTRTYWRGWAGARSSSGHRTGRTGSAWATLCNRRVTDFDDGYVDLSSSAKDGWYCHVPDNLDGKPASASNPVRASPA